MTDLLAPESWHRAHQKDREAACDGCGPKEWKFDLVPDNLLGVPVREACCIHDWEYTVGGSERDRNVADRRFLHNLRALASAAGGPFKPIRWALAWVYYAAVARHGGAFFVYRVPS